MDEANSWSSNDTPSIVVVYRMRKLKGNLVFSSLDQEALSLSYSIPFTVLLQHRLYSMMADIYMMSRFRVMCGVMHRVRVIECAGVMTRL